MKQNSVRHIVFPVLAALIWGTAFVAQSMVANDIGPFTFNLARSAIAAALLAVFCIARRGLKRGPADASPSAPPDKRRAYRRRLLLGGVCCGAALAAAANLQQAGLIGTSAGKAGFITALYIVIVPVLGLLLKKRTSLFTWISVAIAVGGLYFLCIRENFTVAKSDVLVMLCAFIFAAHILLIDHFGALVDGIELSCVQFTAAAVFSGVGAFLWETPSWRILLDCALPLLYVGVFSSCVAYTLQILAQKDANPTVVSLLLSLESVFATLSGALILHDRLTLREYAGCALMLAAVVLAQLPTPRRRSGEAAGQTRIQ